MARPDAGSAGRPPPDSTILVLGSKPQPALPPPGAYAALACANASGFSARAHGLRPPLFTVVSAVLGSGNASDRHSLAAMHGLAAGRVYFLPRPLPEGGWRRLRHRLRHWRLQAPWVRHLLRRHGLVFDRFEQRPTEAYDGLLLELAGGDREIAELIAAQAALDRAGRPGAGPDRGRLCPRHPGRVRLHAQPRLRPQPADRPARHALSKHADTDIAILAAIQAVRLLVDQRARGGGPDRHPAPAGG